MGKIVLMSLILGTVAIPVLCARDRNPRRGLKRLLLFFCLGIVAYVEFVLRLYIPANLERVSASFAEAGFPQKIKP